MPAVRELQTGLWHWQAPHPDWESSEPWGQEVSSYAIDDGKRLLLFDPLGVPNEIEELAAERETAIVLTSPGPSGIRRPSSSSSACPSTRRHRTQERTSCGSSGSAPSIEGFVSPDLKWLFEEEGGEAHQFLAGDRCPSAWRRSRDGRTTTSCSGSSPGGWSSWRTLADFGQGIEINTRWLRGGVTREYVADGLRPLLDLPVELVLPTHGAPTDRTALERALS